MPNDAKLGMVVGVSLVLIFAVVFFRKGSSASPSADIPRALTPAPRMSGGRGPATSPRPLNRIGRPPGQVFRRASFGKPTEKGPHDFHSTCHFSGLFSPSSCPE
jgi:hypothetical protein